GPVDAQTFLTEVRWANDTYLFARMEKQTWPQMRTTFRKGHLDRLSREHAFTLGAQKLGHPDGVSPDAFAMLLANNPPTAQLPNQGKVHLLLAVAPLAPLEKMYKAVFETILNEKVTNQPVADR